VLVSSAEYYPGLCQGGKTDGTIGHGIASQTELSSPAHLVAAAHLGHGPARPVHIL